MQRASLTLTSRAFLSSLWAVSSACSVGEDGGSNLSASAGISSVGITTVPGDMDTTAPDSGSGGSSGSGGTTTQSDSNDSSGVTSNDPTGSASKLDAGVMDVTSTGSVPCEPANSPECACVIPPHMPCDAGTMDPFQAMGLNCPGELQGQATVNAFYKAYGVRGTFGVGGVWNPKEGASYAVIGSGEVQELDQPNDGDLEEPAKCNDELVAPEDPGPMLPPPIVAKNVAGDCTQNPSLLKTGDCSNTIQAQFDAGMLAKDYAELRVVLKVPEGASSLSYDFAFFSTEYPYYYGKAFNDMFVGWIDSESWTGNISFDMMGNPISLNAGFLDHKDMSPALAGTCMNYHAGTNWLRSTANVIPGETITLVFAIFDLSDEMLDSYAFLDNFSWGCEGTGGGPETVVPG